MLRRVTYTLLLLLMLMACGQTGPLYLPEDTATITPAAPGTGAPPPIQDAAP